MSHASVRIRDLECPEWADEWIWDRVMNELGDLVIAHVVGFSASVCFCCGEIHRSPVVKQDDENMNRLFEQLGVDVNGVEPETESQVARAEWRG